MYRGILCLLIAEFCFALSTVFGKFVTTGSDITGVELTFFRFLIGTVAVSAVMITTRISFRPVRTRYVVLRAILNTFAVLAFFTGIQYTTVTNANMLNLTYPVFVFCIAPFLNREKNHPANYLYLCIALIGVYLIINPDFRSINPGDISALLSGVIAGFGISILRESRKYDSSEVILFYLMMIGCLISFFVMLPFFIMPRGMMLVHTLLSGGIAVAGVYHVWIPVYRSRAGLRGIVEQNVVRRMYGGMVFCGSVIDCNNHWRCIAAYRADRHKRDCYDTANEG